MPPTVKYPGQLVENSGLYLVTHYKHREADTESIFRKGDLFPHCLKCDD